MTEMYIDKYRPNSLDELSFNKDINKKLKRLATSNSISHIVIEGIRGSGKRTRALLYLKEKYGMGVMKIKNFELEAQLPTNKKVVSLKSLNSSYHFQLNPSLHGVYDRILLQSFINNIVKYKIISNLPYRNVIIEDADKLTDAAQQSLRRTLETRIGSCRFIFLTNNEGHLIDPILSRCVRIKVSAPSEVEISSILKNIVKTEKLNTSDKMISDIVTASERNLNHALHYLQRSSIMNMEIFEINDLNIKTKISDQIITALIKAKEINVVIDVQAMLYTLMVDCVSPSEILLEIFKAIHRKIPIIKKTPEINHKICKIAADCDNTIRLGGKMIYHLEGFCLKLLKEIKKLMIEKSKENSRTRISLKKKS